MAAGMKNIVGVISWPAAKRVAPETASSRRGVRGVGMQQSGRLVAAWLAERR